MKYILFLSFVFVVSRCCCYTAPSSSSSTSDEKGSEEERTRVVPETETERTEDRDAGRDKKYFDIFKDYVEASHPSVAAPLKKIQTCMEKNDLAEEVELFYANVIQFRRAPLTLRKDICKHNEEYYEKVYKCINKDVSLKMYYHLNKYKGFSRKIFTNPLLSQLL